MSRFLRSLAVVMVAHLCLLLPVSAGAAGDPLPSPPLLVHNATLIAASRARITARDPAALLAAAAAERWAEESLSLGPWSVTQCPHPPPSGDAHAYYSIAKYYWPCNGRPVGCNAAPAACNASGLPWVDCDGLVNPITNEFALPRVANFTSTLAVLAAGFTWTGRVDFAERAAVLVRAWFLDAATRMLPNMAFAQAEPGSNDGSHWGIIELSTNFVAAVLDSVALIAPSGAWTAADHAQLLSWLRDFDAWLRDSALGQQEYGAAPPDVGDDRARCGCRVAGRCPHGGCIAARDARATARGHGLCTPRCSDRARRAAARRGSSHKQRGVCQLCESRPAAARLARAVASRCRSGRARLALLRDTLKPNVDPRGSGLYGALCPWRSGVALPKPHSHAVVHLCGRVPNRS